jgi:hypothetical protein
MLDYEKLGAFYIGKRVDDDSGKLTDELVLYDSKDLTTHAVIIGMTGSGKTGLGIGLLEEAAMDHVPVIAIDPKGDLGNLLLTFPNLAADDFLPWVNTRQATDLGQTPAEFAKAQAALWKKGLGKWGQDGARIAKLRETVDLGIYTPGSTAGTPVSVLRSFAAPDQVLKDDSDLYRERVQATATGILSLIGVDADPVSSREHILISRILDHEWREDRDLDIVKLITQIQDPPFSRIGVMDLESVYPANERFALAMRLNNLLAAPGFEAWLEGAPLDAAKFLYTDTGKPRVSVLSIAHLNDEERMFFVCMLLNELIAWMRAQQGTSSLRAILYMDEVFGYMPPTAKPPSKVLFLTLLKQARAYGLGLVLATQNPVDLDYKGLSNTGTWFIGRLQTERDKARMMDGLEGVDSGGQFDRQAIERTIAGLKKRQFLLHNVHEDEAVVFNTRWVMSYLAGPLTRDQIGRLTPAHEHEAAARQAAAPAVTAGETGSAPLLAPAIRQLFVPSTGGAITYYPRAVALADIGFSNARYKVDEQREYVYTAEAGDGPVAVEWDGAEKLGMSGEDLLPDGEDEAAYAECPASLSREKNYTRFERDFKKWVRQAESVDLYRSAKYKITSEPGETEGEFRVRLQQLASEKRDQAVAKIRKRYATKVTTLENRLMRAQQAIEVQQQQATKKTLDTAVSVGTAILGALLGRKRISSSTATRVGSAIKTASGARKEASDVARAKQTAAKVKADIEALDAELQKEIDVLDSAFDAQAEELNEIRVRPKVADIHVRLVGLVWMPYAKRDDGRMARAY